MKYCIKCGKPSPDDAKLCKNCGNIFLEDNVVANEDEIEDNNRIAENTEEHKESFLIDYPDINKLEKDYNEYFKNNHSENHSYYDSQIHNEDNNTVTSTSEINTNVDNSNSVLKFKKPLIYIVVISILFIAIIGSSQSNKNKSGNEVTTISSNTEDGRIHITLTSVNPAYTVNGNEADIDYDNMKFYWQSDGDNNESREIVENLNSDDFTYSNSTGLKNGEVITVSIEIDEDEYTVTGKKTFKVEFESESDEEDNDDLTIDERLKDADAYIFENSDSEYLNDSQLNEIKTKEQLRIAINEIYARHGYSFTKNSDIQSYFDGKNWYSKDDNLYKDSQMEWNTYEEANLKKLAKMRKGKLKYNPSSAFNI